MGFLLYNYFFLVIYRWAFRYTILGLFVYTWVLQHLLTNVHHPHILQNKINYPWHYFQNNNRVVIKVEFPFNQSKGMQPRLGHISFWCNIFNTFTWRCFTSGACQPIIKKTKKTLLKNDPRIQPMKMWHMLKV